MKKNKIRIITAALLASLTLMFCSFTDVSAKEVKAIDTVKVDETGKVTVISDHAKEEGLMSLQLHLKVEPESEAYSIKFDFAGDIAKVQEFRYSQEEGLVIYLTGTEKLFENGNELSLGSVKVQDESGNDIIADVWVESLGYAYGTQVETMSTEEGFLNAPTQNEPAEVNKEPEVIPPDETLPDVPTTPDVPQEPSPNPPSAPDQDSSSSSDQGSSSTPDQESTSTPELTPSPAPIPTPAPAPGGPETDPEPSPSQEEPAQPSTQTKRPKPASTSAPEESEESDQDVEDQEMEDPAGNDPEAGEDTADTDEEDGSQKTEEATQTQESIPVLTNPVVEDNDSSEMNWVFLAVVIVVVLIVIAAAAMALMKQKKGSNSSSKE